MIIRKKIKAELLKGVIKLPDEIADDALLEITIEELNPAHLDEPEGEHRRSTRELKDLFESRIRAAASHENFTEEVFSLSEVEWQDLNDVKAYFEQEGYGVKMDQQGDNIRIKILWRYV